MSNNRNCVDFGWGAPSIHEQFPELSEDVANHIEKDREAMLRLRIRGYLTDSQRDSVMKKIVKSIEKALNASPLGEQSE
ncbi:hypothetical protein F9K96_05295 [Brucella anthropi]|uniref:hypothetical protein n=1 Tax=Brucella anthropi TaxID=529 RepID=UPI00124D70F5|nr:hypothetical protein [Brucella anthropi]KAB2792559.1 hypothetical protein F9K96_05295 [Brucella anthropi]